MVGCVLVRGGQIVGQGYHRRYGGPHAEIEALNRAGAKARGATAYVTLEPCCHHGKTPPCTDALIRAGVQRVVAATVDPFSEVAGRGLAILREAGIEVAEGLLADEARALNAPYFKLIGTGRPFVTCKWAMSADGKLATASGDSRWITNEQARREAHRLRKTSDVVMVGVGTVLADDPALDVRHVRGRSPAVAVVDSTLRTPLEARLLTIRPPEEVTFYCTGKAPAARRKRLEETGARVVTVKSDDGRVTLDAVLEEMGRRRITNLTIEGGPLLLGEVLRRGLADRVVVFMAPVLIGGTHAPGAWSGEGVARMADARRLVDVTMKRLGDNVMMTGFTGGKNACGHIEQ